MKIKIEAYIYAPSILHWYGGENPFIFKGTFEKKISKKENEHLINGGKITIKGVILTIRNISPKGKITCIGNLPSVSIEFFKKLRQSGWKINKKASKAYGFPDEKKDQEMKLFIQDQNDQIKRSLRTRKSIKKSLKKIEEEELFPYKKFPQVH